MAKTRRMMLQTCAIGAFALSPGVLLAQASDIWSAPDTRAALLAGEAVLIDIRSREEWAETGVAEGAWPISLHEKDFERRLFAAREMAEGRPVALICAVGGRTGAVLKALRRARFDGFVDVSEGMFGSRRGPGWIAAGLPVVSMDEALSTLPEALR